MENMENNVSANVPSEPMAVASLTALAKITMNEAGEFFVENIKKTGNEKLDAKFGPLKFCDEGDKTIVLVKNDANRWWANRAKVTAACKSNIGYYGLEFKESKKFGPATPKTPNEKLIAYLSPEEQEEYKAIIERAMKAKAEATAKPQTELEKAQAARDRAERKYQELLKQASGETITTPTEFGESTVISGRAAKRAAKTE